MDLGSYLTVTTTLLLWLVQTSPVDASETQPLRRSNRPCKIDAECITPNSSCYARSMCLCNDGFIAINVNETYFNCLPGAKGIGDRCELDIQCEKALGSRGTCLPVASTGVGTCACETGSHYKNGICYKTAVIGQRCTVSSECRIKSSDTINSYCYQQYCICPPGYHDVNNGTDCFPSSGLGGPCTSDEGCIALNTKCVGRCTCKKGFVLNNNKNSCIIVASGLESVCFEDIQCSAKVANSVCHPLRKRCVCDELRFHPDNGTCYLSVKLDEACSKVDECRVDRNKSTRAYSSVVCNKGYCQCAPDYDRIGMNCIIKKSIKTAGFANTSSLTSVLSVLLTLPSLLILRLY